MAVVHMRVIWVHNPSGSLSHASCAHAVAFTAPMVLLWRCSNPKVATLYPLKGVEQVDRPRARWPYRWAVVVTQGRVVAVGET